jgi:hypothetical protein
VRELRDLSGKTRSLVDRQKAQCGAARDESTVPFVLVLPTCIRAIGEAANCGGQ